MSKIVAILIFLVGFINFYPAIGVVSAERLQSLYGIAITDNNLLIVMKHRAIMFGIVGAFMMFSAFKTSYQPAAIIAGGISMLSFILIALLHPGMNDLIKRIMYVDIVASIILLVAVALLVLLNRSLGFK